MDFFKIQQQREMTYSKSSNRERGVTQNPARERDELLKIQQQREKLNIFCVAVKRFRRYARESCTCAVLYCTILYPYQLLYANIDILV